MKTLLFITILLLSSQIYGQVSGDVAVDKRPIVSNIKYKVNGSKAGTIVFLISVDEKGDVISCTIDKINTTIMSTPTTIKAGNLITSELKFEPNSIYPKFHKGIVSISVIKN